MPASARTLIALLLTAASASADVLIVDKSGSQGFSTVQAAINASQDGDIILVRSGTYPTFTVSVRSLVIRADLGSEVVIASGVNIQFTPQDGVVVMSDLEIRGQDSNGSQPGGVALKLTDNLGHVRIERCDLLGGSGKFVNCQVNTAGGDACTLSNSPSTAFVDCLLRGGAGGGDFLQPCFGGAGGRGLFAGLSAFALYDCTVMGGSGGPADLMWATTGGKGGAGLTVFGGWCFASNTKIGGGSGGHAGIGGDGGDGLTTVDVAQVQLLGSSTLGGHGGIGDVGPDGVKGQDVTGSGQVVFLPGSARTLEAPALAMDAGSIAVQVKGLPGDQTWIVAGWSPGHSPGSAVSGVWLVSRPGFLTKAPQLLLGPGGTGSVQLPLVDLTAAQGSSTLFLQSLTKGLDGTFTLGSPAHVSVLECATEQPDCNGSGSFDLCDVLAGSSSDCDGNAVPDECDPDCNGNGFADACDLAAGTSEDLNHNGIPDECEPSGVTWYVDHLSAPGGDGSATSPFKTIGDAMSIALGGDTILVAPAVYKGAKNRNLVFGGRDLVLRGMGGSSVCIIDCEDVDPAFVADDGETAASLIEGFTIRNGRNFDPGGGIALVRADTTIRDVVFVSCRSTNGGGALDLTDSLAVVSDCRFEGNSASRGGALSIHEGSPRVSSCTFLGNSSSGGVNSRGGAIYVSSGFAVLLTHLKLIGNTSSRGGGVMVEGGAVNLANCLFAGNSASRGAAILVSSGSLYVRGSTLADNFSSLVLGAIYSENLDGLPRNLRLDNCIDWDDPALNGGLIVNVSAGVTVQIESSNLRGGASSIVLAAGSSLAWGQGNLDLDPLFVDPDGPDNVSASFFDNDYRLGPLSPCIDAGYNVWVIPDVYDLDGDGDKLEPTPIDLDGLPRFVDDPAVPDTGAGTPPIVDMGAYERP
jgi:hypothetical protein